MFIMQDATTLRYEELLLRDPYSVKQWLAYLIYHQEAPPEVRTPTHPASRCCFAAVSAWASTDFLPLFDLPVFCRRSGI